MPLLKISLFFAIIGTALLLFLSTTLEPRLTRIKDIEMKDLDLIVKIHGEVNSIRTPGNITILNIRDNTDEIDVVVYEKINITQNMNVEVIGKVSEYNYNVQIEADKIKRL